MMLAVVAAIVAAVVAAHVPNQTAYQANLTARVRASAAQLSAEAEGPLLARLGSPSFRKGLQKCCPSLMDLTPQDLLQRLQAEIRVSEVVSGFPALGPSKFDSNEWWDPNLQ